MLPRAVLAIVSSALALAPAAASPDLAGYWTGAYVRMDATLRVNAWIQTRDDGSLTCRQEFPDWISHEWSDATPVELDQDGRVVIDGLYGSARLAYDARYLEMIGPVGTNAPALTLHLKRAVPPPIIPITERELRFESDVSLAGTLVSPAGPGPHAAVLLLPGRGCHPRSRLIGEARALARYGIAALVHDQRGTGDSGGECGTVTFEQLVDDAEAAYRSLVAQPEIDARRTGVKANSAGTWTAQALAGRSLEDASLPPVAFLVSWVGPATSIERQQRESGEAIARSIGLDAAQAALVQRHVDVQLDAERSAVDAYAELERIESIARAEGWLDRMFAADDFPAAPDELDRLWLRRHRFDPATVLARLERTPYLAIFGAEDDVVPATSNIAALRRALGADAPLRILTLPGVGHALEHGDVVRSLPGAPPRTVYYKFERVEPRFWDATLAFLRDLGMMPR